MVGRASARCLSLDPLSRFFQLLGLRRLIAVSIAEAVLHKRITGDTSAIRPVWFPFDALHMTNRWTKRLHIRTGDIFRPCRPPNSGTGIRSRPTITWSNAVRSDTGQLAGVEIPLPGKK
jgi:hypothetical protein